MDTIIPFLLLGLSVFSMVIYLKSTEKLIMRVAKGITAFIFPVGALGAFLSGDYATALTISVIVFLITIRRMNLNKKDSFPSVATEQNTHVNKPKPFSGNHNTKDWFKNISFSYTDSNGNSSYREVDIKEINEQSMTGYCHSRRQLRTFRLDRIDNSEIVIRDTGELINVYDWIVQLYEERG
ncbi:WYL domain-containing protein [Citrobacter freundii]